MKRVSMSHFRELFGFSINLAIIGLKDTFLGTLPVLILARSAGLHEVPIYTITNRVSGMMRSLAIRVNHSFLPELTNLHITRKNQIFLLKFRRSLILASAVALAAAAIVLLLNHSVVVMIAGSDFYAGDKVTGWFSLMLVVGTISSVYQALLHISGNMGKSIPFAIVNVLIMVVMAPISYKLYGMVGLAAVFAFQPILYGIYGLVRGARNCSYALKDFMNFGMIASVISIAAVIGIGCFMDSSHPLGSSYLFFGKSFLLPSLSQIICSGILLCISMIFIWFGVIRNIVK
jgi:O-antigen/teichoic acid export membrane protein